ncbi:hypothetical protein I302_103679 [Kwoniella bestiolae CBS 10118]|uniref:RecA family profile 1 domain-containing protein n=1 Tax=Kwoniella bestiolae CBS 10118 TaxID=1296100 RepID=A0A1B9G938_9TREE|nr:hypothetical protein I302_02384 [Kwoniella bestiolae CBS 10118]OCF27542.1 hypothetical protein I302_02384 [Kwoniella bestiolae CBS 10118]
MIEPYLHYSDTLTTEPTTIASLSTSSILLTPLPRLSDLLKVKIPIAQSYVRQVSHAIAPSTKRLDEIYDQEQSTGVGPSRLHSDDDDETLDRKGKGKAKWVSTGDAGLDEALGGGIRRGCLYEITGESAAGKSHLSLHLALTFQLPSLTSSPGGSLILTSERELSTDRLVQLGQHLLSLHEPTLLGGERRVKNLLDNILTNRVGDVDALEHALNYAIPAILESRLDPNTSTNHQLPIRLIILDSITALFRGGTNDHERPTAPNALSLAERSKHLCIVADALKAIAVKYDLSILIINQVSDVFQRSTPVSYSQPTSSFMQTQPFTGQNNANPEDIAMIYKTQSRWFSGESEQLKKEASLGIVWANAVNVRIMLSRTGRRRLLDQYNLTSHKRNRPEDRAYLQNEEEGDIRPTLIRKLHVVFSPFSPASTIDYVITPSGVHTLLDSYKKIDVTSEVIRKQIKEEKDRINSENENAGFSSQVNEEDEGGEEELRDNWDEVFDEFGELPEEFWKGEYELGVVDVNGKGDGISDQVSYAGYSDEMVKRDGQGSEVAYNSVEGSVVGSGLGEGSVVGSGIGGSVANST